MIHHFQQILAWKKEENALQLSDAADFGISHYTNAKANLDRPFKSVLDLQGAFQGIPAIIVGAGPSLEKNGDLLAAFQTKALVFSGGSALDKILCTPHFGVCIDKRTPLTCLQNATTPLCFQARMHPENFRAFHGEALLAPDSHFSFLNYLSGDAEMFDGGWTVGNFMAALAVHCGCDPIVSVGMDYCYREKQKYAFDSRQSTEELIQTNDALGNLVWTQRDWLMAIQWMENLAYLNPEVEFLNATDGGMGYWTPKALHELTWKEIPDLQEKVDRAIANIAVQRAPRFFEWEQNLRKALKWIQDGDNQLENEDVYRQLLLPLWKIWEPIFEQDPSPISLDRKMKIHQRIFFEKVILEHLNAIS